MYVYIHNHDKDTKEYKGYNVTIYNLGMSPMIHGMIKKNHGHFDDPKVLSW